ncbi:MAG: hypothetical protein M1837_006474 [Sclerophora amabilis]|nr:MAG: hypothetical protein M1837_006474 [Sclerophora amabilis]
MASPFNCFEDLDDDDVFVKYEAAVESPDIRNFVVDFGKDQATGALDVDLESWKDIVKAERPASASTRWISIWAPNSQKGTIKVLAHHYGFSPRLLAIMCSEPLVPQSVPTDQSRFYYHHLRARFRGNEDKLGEQRNVDPEKRGTSMDSEALRSHHLALDVNHYRLVDEVWHYSSVDWGERCYNSVQSSSIADLEGSGSDDDGRDVPKGKRIWSWLILCDDGTVISMYEDIFSGPNGASMREPHVLLMIRRNLLNIFRQLSNAQAASGQQNPLSILGIRRGLGSLDGDVQDASQSLSHNVAASLLFHYLFDDWYSSYGLVARQEHQYGRELNRLRGKLLERADFKDIKVLHHVGRQLAVLKRVYESYKSIIDRILKKQKLLYAKPTHLLSDSNRGAHHNKAVEEHDDTSASSQTDSAPHPSLATEATTKIGGRLGVTLAPAALDRFERLRDRISLYALSEIQDCLDEKESMVFMTFNLIAMKESKAVERLTRITILLAKVTILFLPVSLMTAYFSVEIEDLQGVYTTTTYWVCFGVIMALSILLLFVFGLISDTVEGKMIYQPLTKRFVGAARVVLGRQKAKWR